MKPTINIITECHFRVCNPAYKNGEYKAKYNTRNKKLKRDKILALGYEYLQRFHHIRFFVKITREK